MLTKNNYGTMLIFFCLAIFAIAPSQQNQDLTDVRRGSCQAFGLNFDECDFACRYQGYMKGYCGGFLYTSCWCKVPLFNSLPTNSV
uniref:Teratocyte defensin n=1 Tax=Cotesia flavipes TaxID=89805 RepID=A0A8K1YTQ9_COTFL|nr:teratocyte defensin [Cotesia flavipes]